MEDWHSQELQDYVRAEGAYAREYLQALPRRQELYEHLQAANVTALKTFAPQMIRAGNKLFALRLFTETAVPVLVVHDPDQVEARPRILYDPNTDPAAMTTTIDWFLPSGDGAFVACGLSQGGSENSTLHILDTITGKELAVSFPRVMGGGVCWLPDHRTLAFLQLKEPTPDQPETERYNDGCVYLYRLAEPDAPLQPAMRRGLNPSLPVARTDFPVIWSAPHCAWVFAVPLHGVQNELTICAVPVSELLADPSSCQWRRLVDVADGVTRFTPYGDEIFLVTSHMAPHNKVVAMSLIEADFAAARVVIPEGQSVITEIGISGDRLLVQDFLVDIDSLRSVPLSGGEPDNIKLPVAGNIVEWAALPGTLALFVNIQSITVPPTIYRKEPGPDGDFVDTHWLPKPDLDTSSFLVEEVRIPSHDGIRVPMTIVCRPDLVKNGTNPTLVMGYGSYGFSDLAVFLPLLRPFILTWVDQGGVFAFGHLRGSGALGKEWYEAGRKSKKENTILDFIACGEYLIREGYTSSAHLAAAGTSAGGIPAAGALVRRPELFAAVILDVALLNTLRYEFSENGPGNIPEFGTVADPEDFAALLRMDALHLVRDGVAYPAVLLTTGLNDPRVVVWEATKMTARLQAATSSGRPILLRVEEQGGHGALGATSVQINAQWADELAFLRSVMSGPLN
jgi:prolyl oligopeptidase